MYQCWMVSKFQWIMWALSVLLSTARLKSPNSQRSEKKSTNEPNCLELISNLSQSLWTTVCLLMIDYELLFTVLYNMSRESHKRRFDKGLTSALKPIKEGPHWKIRENIDECISNWIGGELWTKYQPRPNYPSIQAKWRMKIVLESAWFPSFSFSLYLSPHVCKCTSAEKSNFPFLSSVFTHTIPSKMYPLSRRRAAAPQWTMKSGSKTRVEKIRRINSTFFLFFCSIRVHKHIYTLCIYIRY